MVTWNNLDQLASFEELKKVERVNLAEVMSGENGMCVWRDFMFCQSVPVKLFPCIGKKFFIGTAKITDISALMFGDQVLCDRKKRLVIFQRHGRKLLPVNGNFHDRTVAFFFQQGIDLIL